MCAACGRAQQLGQRAPAGPPPWRQLRSGHSPLYTGRAQDEDLELLAHTLHQYRSDPRLLAVGEIGLDYFVPGLDAERQQRFYREQLVLARRFDLPVILHVRRSADQLLKALRQVKVRGGIAHAFNGSLQQAQAFVALGFKLGFGGAVTYDRALQLRRLAAELPLGSVVMETDSPDIPPHWLYTTAAERAQGQPQGRNTLPSCPALRRWWLVCAAWLWRTWPRPAPPMPAPHCRGCRSYCIKMACSAYLSSAYCY